MRTGYEKHTLSNAAIWCQSDEKQLWASGALAREMIVKKEKLKIEEHYDLQHISSLFTGVSVVSSEFLDFDVFCIYLAYRPVFVFIVLMCEKCFFYDITEMSAWLEQNTLIFTVLW